MNATQMTASMTASSTSNVDDLPDKPPVLEREKTEKVVKEKVVKEKKVRAKKQPVMKDSSEGSSDSTEKKRENKWLNEVRKYRDANPTCSYKDALKGAKEHYKRE